MGIGRRWGSHAAKLLCAVGLAMGATASHAQAWPTKPIKIILPFAAGGGGDTVMRQINQRLSDALGQQVVLENAPGAGGALGMKLAQRAPADGYTFVMISDSHAILETLQPNLGYRMLKDFVPVAPMVSLPMMLLVNPSLPVKSTQELITYAKANPGKLSYSTPGTGSVYHLMTEEFSYMAGIKMLHVPYKSSATARTDLISGQVNVMFDGIATMKSFVDNGRVRALAVSTAARNPIVPDLAPVAATVPGFDADIWVAMMAPAGTPQVAVDGMNAAIVKVLSNPDVRKGYADQASVPTPGTPAALGSLIQGTIDKWAKTIKMADVKAE